MFQGWKSWRPTGEQAVLLPPPLQMVQALGVGGQGEAWLAHDPVLNRRLICKRLHKTSDQLHSLRALANLEITGVPTLYGVSEYNGAYWVMQEYVEGVSLAEVLNHGGEALGAAQVLSIFTDLATALSGLHSLGVMHGDVAPGNVVITDEGSARFIDFGLSCRLGETPAGEFQPTLPAPEYVIGAEATATLDRFSLGVLIYALLGVEPPVPVPGADERVLLLHPQRPVLASVAEEIVWAGARALTDADPARRPNLAMLSRSLQSDERRLPSGSRENLGRLVSQQRAAQQTEASILLPAPAPAPSPEGFGVHRLWQIAGVLLVAMTFGALFLSFDQEQKPVYQANIGDVTVSATTELPANFNESWLIAHVRQVAKRQWQPGNDPEHVLGLSLFCDGALCQLTLRHAVDDDHHWHQRSLMATPSAGVWRGAIRELLHAAARH